MPLHRNAPKMQKENGMSSASDTTKNKHYLEDIIKIGNFVSFTISKDKYVVYKFTLTIFGSLFISKLKKCKPISY